MPLPSRRYVHVEFWHSPGRHLIATVLAAMLLAAPANGQEETLLLDDVDVYISSIQGDADVRYDYDIIYVRADRAGDDQHKRFFTDFSQPVTMQPGADLMLLHPDGSEELLVDGGTGSVTDPVVSFDGQWVYYSYIYNLEKPNQWNPPSQGADIFKINLATRRIVRLTNQQFTPNTGAAPWASDYRTNEKDKTWFDYGVFNMGPHPLPDGRFVFTSNRDGFEPAKGYPTIALQLFTMDDRDESIGEQETPQNLEKIGHLNISGALHPVTLRDGRIMYSSLESQGIRSEILWGLWTINPDGTMWNPMVSAFDPGGAPNGFHFQSQLTDGSVVVEEYYNQNNSGFGAYVKLPASPRPGYPAFGPGYMRDDRNQAWRYGRHYNGKPNWYRKPFMPTGSVSLTPFTHGREGPADPSVLGDKSSPAVGKVTHPSGAPENHLLTAYTPGPANHQYTYLPQIDSGIYLLKHGEITESPSQLRVIKNDPAYNECWPRAVVPYERIYGVSQPAKLPELANDGSLSPHLPEGTPFGLIGTSSFYKRESYPNGQVPEGQVTSGYAGGTDPWQGLDAFTSHGNQMPLNWANQGAEAGLYTNDDIHAVRVLVMEPTTHRDRGAHEGRRFYSHAKERLRILGEIPLRKFTGSDQPLDPDGNPDTSFLAKIPADTAFTFQTIDRHGMLLNSAQTWHQLRPGEVRHDCGGCHSHSQKPTHFALTEAAKEDYKVWDLVKNTPLVTDREHGTADQKFDINHETSLAYADEEVVNVEYHRDIAPILQRSCVACHSGEKSPASLDLNADGTMLDIPHTAKVPGTYYRLAVDERAQFGYKPVGYDTWGYPNASRYIRKFQSRRSLLVWKLYGGRLDGFTNDSHPSESKPGARDLVQNGEPVDMQKNRHRWDLDHYGQQMPPPEAVAAGKVEPLTDQDRRTMVRWIDLGCPIDLDYDPNAPASRGHGWMLDDNRPILTLTQPVRGTNEKLERIVIGMHDYYTGIEPGSLSVTASFAVEGKEPGTELADKFQKQSPGVWTLVLQQPIKNLEQAKLTVSVRDGEGNTTQLERTFSVK